MYDVCTHIRVTCVALRLGLCPSAFCSTASGPLSAVSWPVQRRRVSCNNSCWLQSNKGKIIGYSASWKSHTHMSHVPFGAHIVPATVAKATGGRIFLAHLEPYWWRRFHSLFRFCPRRSRDILNPLPPPTEKLKLKYVAMGHVVVAQQSDTLHHSVDFLRLSSAFLRHAKRFQNQPASFSFPPCPDKKLSEKQHNTYFLHCKAPARQQFVQCDRLFVLPSAS